MRSRVMRSSTLLMTACLQLGHFKAVCSQTGYLGKDVTG